MGCGVSRGVGETSEAPGLFENVVPADLSIPGDGGPSAWTDVQVRRAQDAIVGYCRVVNREA